MSRWGRAVLALAAALTVGIAVPAPVGAERLEAAVRNEAGAPVQDAVVYALPFQARKQALARPESVTIDQVDKEFVPSVTAVPVGTSVSFPNRDQIRHHVYSFSEAKTFEIPLYKGTPAEDVRFDKSGEVVLGCNIHDWMKAYVFVLDTPYFAVTDETGTATLELPAEGYRVEVWHPRLEGEPAATGREVRVAPGGHPQLHFSIRQKRLWNPRRAPALVDRRYR